MKQAREAVDRGESIALEEPMAELDRTEFCPAGEPPSMGVAEPGTGV